MSLLSHSSILLEDFVDIVICQREREIADINGTFAWSKSSTHFLFSEPMSPEIKVAA